MKVTVKLSPAELKGIVAYLLETDGARPNKGDVQVYIQGIVSTTLHSPREAVSDYINNS